MSKEARFASVIVTRINDNSYVLQAFVRHVRRRAKEPRSSKLRYPEYSSEKNTTLNMHHQLYEEEFEPRVIPKPITKRDCFVAPTVPEVSLIFENATAAVDPNNQGTAASSSRLVQVTDSVSCNPNSYAAWKEETYSTNTTRVSPVCNNAYNYTCVLPSSGLQTASLQKRQERAKAETDKWERLQNANKSERTYEKSVKFQCSSTGDSYNLESQTRLSSDKRSSSCTSPQKATLGVRTPNHGGRSSDTISDTLKKSQPFQTTPHSGYQHACAPNHSTCTVDNTTNETVKTLLQLVNSQNEQIKSLQFQVDRLVRLQEETFRNKAVCLCPQPLANQVFRYPRNGSDAAFVSSLAQSSQNHGIKKTVASQNTPVVERQESFGENNNGKLETALLDVAEQHATKTFMEQKVSIGVMTSFEFTMQNSPFMIDSENICEKKEAHREGSAITRAVTIHDTTEPVNRYKNTFTRIPGAAQLENIVEDSESYLSFSQQQSSNFNASSSAKDSSKRCPSADLNREKAHKDIYVRKAERERPEVEKRPNTSMDVAVDCSPRGSTTSTKALVGQPNAYIATNERRSYETNHGRVADQHPLRDVHLAARDYYHNYRNKEYGTTVRQRNDHMVGDSMTLSGGDLEILERPPPTPEPSVHVEMQEYGSDDESDKLRHTSKIGWTFYNNVLGQVNEILQNSGVTSDKDLNHAKPARNIEQETDTENRTALNTVKATTLEQLRRLGISLTENTEHRESNGNRTLDFDSSFYPRLDHQATMTHTTSVVNETNTSMHMKALALKYLSDEQLADIAWQKQESSSLKHLMLSNMQGTNMSLATMRYLERYQLLPGKNTVQAENTEQIYDKAAFKNDFKPAAANNNPTLRRYPLVQTSGTCPSRILDLSTLKRQPKLL